MTKILSRKWKIPNIALFDSKRSMDVLNKHSSIFLDDLLVLYQKKIQEAAPVGATGLMKNTIFNQRLSSTMGRVYANTKYAIVINNGRKASPISKSADESLKAWITRSSSGRSYFAGLQATYPKITVAQAIFILKRSKKNKPTKPNPFFNKGVKKARPSALKYYTAFSNNLARDLFR